MVPALKELEEGRQDKAAEKKDAAPLLNARTATIPCRPSCDHRGVGSPSRDSRVPAPF